MDSLIGHKTAVDELERKILEHQNEIDEVKDSHSKRIQEQGER